MLLRRLCLAGGLLFAVAIAAACSDSNDALGGGGGAAPDAGGGGRSSSADAGTGDGGAKAPSSGCNGGASKPATTGLSTGLTLSVAGKDRSYDLSVPEGYDPSHAYPVVFVFHGGSGTAKNARDTFGFESIAGDKSLFVYPQGLGDWDLDTPAETNEDVAFFDALVEKLEADLCVDASRVFATGSSNGAYMANQLGCRRGAKLRAIASHAGGGPYEADDLYDENGNLICKGGTPPAALIVHGEDDGVVALSEGQLSVKYWKYANQCNDDTTAYPPDPCVAYGACAKPVVWCQIPGLGHGVWEQGPQLTWDFFASF